MQTEAEKHAETLMKHYPHRVLAYLKTLPIETLQVVGRASEEEANANFHSMMLDETAKQGCE